MQHSSWLTVAEVRILEEFLNEGKLLDGFPRIEYWREYEERVTRELVLH